MKLLLLALLLTAVTFADKKGYDEMKYQKLLMECGQELSIPPQYVDLVSRGVTSVVGSRGPELKNCLVRCLFRKVGFISENGTVHVGDYHDVIPRQDLVKKAMEQCQHVVVKTCGDAEKLAKCRDDVLKKIM